jgi:hypothetical protein
MISLWIAVNFTERVSVVIFSQIKQKTPILAEYNIFIQPYLDFLYLCG